MVSVFVDLCVLLLETLLVFIVIAIILRDPRIGGFFKIISVVLLGALTGLRCFVIFAKLSHKINI